MDKCPICGEELTKLWSYTLDGWCLEEEAYECQNCKMYGYDYSYGATCETYGLCEFYHSYDRGYNQRTKEKIKVLIATCRAELGIEVL